MSAPKLPDELLLRYQEASAQDERRPASAVREAVRAHAQMVIRDRQHPASRSTPHLQAAANQTRWKLSLLASIALVGLTSLLVLQFDRGTPEEQELALGRPKSSAENTPRSPAPVSAPQSSANSAEKLSDAAPHPALAKKSPADTQPPAKRPAMESKAELFKGQQGAREVESVLPKPSGMMAAPSPAAEPRAEQAPAVAPAVQALPQFDVAPVPAPPATQDSALASGSGAASTNTAQRAAKSLAVPEAASSSRQILEKSELQMKRSEERADKAAPSARALNAALLDSARAGQVAQMERLLQQGALINSTDEQGRTPLILAAMNGQTSAVAKLLALGANPTVTDREGLNALQHARRLGFNQIEHLLEAGP